MKNYLLIGAFALLLIFAGCVSTPPYTTCDRMCANGTTAAGPSYGNACSCPEDTNATLWLSYQPIRCNQNPWEIWEANSDRTYIRAPTEKEILTSYYSQVHNVGLLDYRIKGNGISVYASMACSACTCPLLHNIFVKVHQNDAQKILSLGWQEAQEPEYDCPQWTPPSPDFCENGKIVSSGVDSHGCQLPPKCIPNPSMPKCQRMCQNGSPNANCKCPEDDLPPNPPN